MGQISSLVSDINTGAPSPNASAKSAIKLTTTTGDILILAIDDPLSGSEIWRSDGTEEGTSLILDIVPGPGNSEPLDLTIVEKSSGNLVFFTALDASGNSGIRSLWVTRGDRASTMLLKTFEEGFSPRNFTAFNGRLFFEGYDGNNGSELWESDGTVSGTKLNTNISPGGGNSNPNNFFNQGNTLLYFTAYTAANHRELWSMDSSFVPTLYADSTPGTGSLLFPDGLESTADAELTAFDGQIYFVGEDSRKLWKTSGPGMTTTTLVTDPSPDGNAQTRSLTVMSVGGTSYLFAVAANTANNLEVRRLNTGTSTFDILREIGTTTTGSSPQELTVVGNRLYFTADNGEGRALYVSNGTPGGTGDQNTAIVADSLPGTDPGNLTALGTDTLVFTAFDENGVLGLYFCNPDETTLSTPISLPLAQFEDNSVATEFTVIGDSVYFLINGAQLWVTNGIDSATMVKDFQVGNASSFPTGMTKFGDNVFFSATDGTSGQELWKTNGTTTERVKDIRTGVNGSSPDSFTPAGETLFFIANVPTGAGTNNREVWRTDGTSEGTEVVTNNDGIEISSLPAPADQSSRPQHLTSIDGVLYFSAWNKDTGAEPWKVQSNGPATMIAEIGTGTTGSDPNQFVKCRDSIYFVATGSGNTRRLRSIANPTVPIVTANALTTDNTGPSSPQYLTVYGTGANQQMYFAATHPFRGNDLWKSNGTNLGTQCIDIVTASGSSFPRDLTVANNVLYFSAENSGTGRELWRSNGNRADTKIVKEIAPGITSSSPENLTEVGGLLFFTATTAATGRELWVSNGSATGTFMLKEIGPGTADANIQGMKNVDGLLIFSADNGKDGREAWYSDGTVAGTNLLEDLAPLSASSYPTGFMGYQGKLVYAASSAEEGNELRIAQTSTEIEVVYEDAPLVPLALNDTVNLGSAEFKIETITKSFTIKNVGVNRLLNVKPLISGVNASEFTFVSPAAATSVSKDGFTTVKVKFTPKEGGLRQATLSILSNDLDENPFVINLEANGEKDPFFVGHPQSKMVNVNEPVNFSAVVFNSVPTDTLVGQWRKVSTKLTGPGAVPSGVSPLFTTYTIPAATIKDAGSYNLSVKGALLTSISNSAELGVVQDNTPPLVIVAGLTKTATFKVTAAGNLLKYRWMRQRDGELAATDLTQVVDARITGAATKTMTLKNLASTDTASYFCLVSNPSGDERQGGTTQLNVFTQPALIESQNMPDGIVGGEYSYQIAIDPDASRAALTYSAKGLPSGLKLDTKTGLITGRPTKASPPEGYTITLTAKNSIVSTLEQSTTTDNIIVEAYPTNLEGIYIGTVARNTAVNRDLGGRLDLTVTKTGAYSGSLTLGATKLSIKGAVNVFLDAEDKDPTATFQLKPAASSGLPAFLALTFEIDRDAGVFTANTKVTDGSSDALITGWRKVDTIEGPKYETYYTFGMRLPSASPLIGEASEEIVPQGWSYASFKAAKDGKLTFAGRTADGDKVTGASFIGVDGNVVLYQSMYTPLKGSLMGTLLVNKGSDDVVPTDNTLTGALTWVRPNDIKAKTRTYIAGFGFADTPVATPVALEAIGSAYVKPEGTNPVFGLPNPSTTPNVDVEFLYGDLSDTVISPNVTVTISTSNKITQDTTSTTLTKLASVTASTGLFTGSFSLSDPDLLLGGDKKLVRKVTYQGILINDETDTQIGVGFFTLPKRPAVAPEKITTVPILGGKVEVKAIP
ncbi:ELWxxDGT repeat protein [Prosthecobacter fusiformis]|uniref:ELWxxDGT repeat protein n=2 Tax=Prosthecobacter fusiformis TaxID=48464 RepID=A0A4R7RPE6_9BACT|nr:ELWxxDGT repeat protein [Prosthecobacter fusiformis]